MSEEIKVSEQKQRKKVILWIILSLLVLTIGVATYELFIKKPPAKDPVADLLEDAGGEKQSGGVDVSNAEQIRAKLQKQTDESYMNYKINVHPVFSNSNSEGNLMIENTKGNKNILQVVIKEDETGDVIFTSASLNPDESIQSAKLSKKLKKGTYNAIAYFKCYNPETKEQVGEAGMRLVITIQG